MSRVAALLLLLAVVHAHNGVDLTLLSEHVFPALTDVNRSIAFEAPLRRTMFRECAQPPSAPTPQRLVLVVFDAGTGAMALAAAQVAASHSHVHIVTVAPHDAPALAPIIHATLTGNNVESRVWPMGGAPLPAAPRVLVVQVMDDVAPAIAAIVGDDVHARVSACAIVCDLVLSSYRLMSSHIAGVAQLVYSGRVSEVTRVLPASLRVHVRAVNIKDAARLTSVDPLATEGIDLSHAFRTLPNATFWAAERPAYIGEWGRTVEVAAPYTGSQEVHDGQPEGGEGSDGSFKLTIADIATRLVSARLPYSHSMTLRVHKAGAANALVWWYHLIMDEDITLAGTPAELESPRAPPTRSITTPPRLVQRFGSCVPILPSPLRVAVGDPLPVKFIINSKLVFTATTLPPRGAPPPPPVTSTLALWHVSMINDAPRNYAYAEAIRRAVAATPHPTVLELGAGAGLLAAVAANAGAHVVAVEGNQNMVPRLQATVDSLGADVAARVTVVGAHSSDLRVQASAEMDASGAVRGTAAAIAQRADILVHEIFDYTVTGEGVMPSVHDALSRLIRSDAPVIIPARVRVWGAFVRSDALRSRFSLAPFLRASGTPFLPGLATLPLHMIIHAVNMRTFSHKRVSAPFVLWDVSFDAIPDPLRAGNGATLATVDVVIPNRTRVDALVTWFSLEFDQGEDLTYTTSEEDMEFADHWYQGVHMMYIHSRSPGKDVHVQANDVLRVESRVQSFGYGGFPGVRPHISVIPGRAPVRDQAAEASGSGAGSAQRSRTGSVSA